MTPSGIVEILEYVDSRGDSDHAADSGKLVKCEERRSAYFGSDGPTIVVLVAGGTKVRQQQDINRANDRWRDYKRRKRQGELKWR